MNITLNGKLKELPSEGVLADIVASFGKQPRHIIAELNGTIIPSAQWSHTSLKEGDSLELVTFVGGG